MANLVYKRVSTDRQSTDRQNLVLDEAGIENPVVFEEEAGTSSRLHPLEHATDLEPTEHATLDQGVTVRRGQGYTLRVSATPSVHRQLLPAASPSTAPREPRRSPHSARPAASTRTASTPWRLTPL
ncbi:hypothetical protein ACFVXE_38560 [Streptomyces sp. NPDC058231]|uniref:hypothetical protein n=1 Tax=Streptomyces sp. NPDC058231 TaxID=3346392 RepID=UPI0036ECEF35